MIEIDVQKAIANNKHTLAVFFDLNKAYDTAWRRGGLIKLKECRLCGNLPKFIANFMQDRKIQVRIGKNHSQPRQANSGIPQGSVLLCTCFMIAIKDIVKTLPPHVHSTLHVDDFTIYTTGNI